MKQCGSCSACCKVMIVKTLDKPAGKWCPHACSVKGNGHGCEIYVDRPKECHSFNCAWLFADWMGDDMRPDKCGAVLSVSRSYEKLLHVNPVSYAAGVRPRVMKVIRELCDAGNWIVLIALRENVDGKTDYDIMGRQSRVIEYHRWQNEQQVSRLRASEKPNGASVPDVLTVEGKEEGS